MTIPEQAVEHEQARRAAQRLVNSHFRNEEGEHARTRIPAQADDDDLLLMRYIRQQEALVGVQRPEDVARADALHDSAYIAGAKAGYNCGVTEDQERLKRIIDGRDGYLAALPHTGQPQGGGMMQSIDIEQFKKLVIGKLMAQRHRITDDMNMVEHGWKARENDVYDKAIEIVALAVFRRRFLCPSARGGARDEGRWHGPGRTRFGPARDCCREADGSEVMEDALYKKLESLRTEYRSDMNAATNKVQEYAACEDMELVSEWSSRAERKREAFSALNRAIKIVEDHAALSS